MCEWAEDEGRPSGLALMPDLQYNYGTDGSSEYVDLGWRHVEPPLHWNVGHPDRVWTDWNGLERAYDPRGTLRRESFVLHSQKFGRTTYWDEHGHIAARGLYWKGVPIGRWLVWDDSVLPYLVEFSSVSASMSAEDPYVVAPTWLGRSATSDAVVRGPSGPCKAPSVRSG
jgi:hypothetical protein